MIALSQKEPCHVMSHSVKIESVQERSNLLKVLDNDKALIQ